ncbi:hypothetical protein [Phreatobacter cathodiphilus]|uniref:Methyl-accepting chemotaxis protein n=1 Tax=Phreatobacter cathodiphilus TaxID=1868589 RepID=A0A2S0NF99_9HYPH|nr:hypothetical protein [Phreatobacter cathodiphilus]AVO46706.1 hypothetical protein C6569_17455 [Phreatobacter cathodiphilus]
MPHRDAIASLNQALAAIDVMIRSGKGQGGRLVDMAREARQAASVLAAPRPRAPAAPRDEAVTEEV